MDITTIEAQVALGNILKTRFDEYVTDRKNLELQFIKNLRQYRGVYDPEIEAKLPPDRSKVYPKETHTKVIGFVAKMMEMMFPASEKNWEVVPTEIPSIPEQALTGIITQLQQKAREAQVDGKLPMEVTSDMIESAVREFATARAKNMEKAITDQLEDLGGDMLGYPQLCRKVIRSGGIYGYGVLSGPQVQYITQRIWVDDGQGSYKAETKSIPRPFYEAKKVWNIYPDLSAPTWRHQMGLFERIVMNKHDTDKLKKRSDFISVAIDKIIRDNPTGNYKPQSYENDLKALAHADNVVMSNRNKYEIIRWVGYVSGKELFDAGVPQVKESEFDEDVFADIWLIGNIIIKIGKAPFGDNPADIYHAFIFEEDEDSGLTGTGLPEVLRDSQMRLCSIDRATQDNMAACAGPIYVVNKDLIPPGSNAKNIHSFATIEREGLGQEATAKAVEQLATDSHVTELIALRREVLETFDRESSLPSWLFGATQQLGEAFRTTNNMSVMSGGANMVTKDVVRAFDIFTQSVIGSAIRWNMEFNPDPEIKGDFNVLAKGNISLVAKEIRGAALDQFWSTLSETEKLRFKEVDVLIERLKSRDLPVSLLEEMQKGEEKVAAYLMAQQKMQDAEAQLTTAKTDKLQADAEKAVVAAQSAKEKLKAEIAEILSRVDTNISTVKDRQTKIELEHIKMLLQAFGDDLERKLKAGETSAKILTMGGNNEPGTRSAATAAP